MPKKYDNPSERVRKTSGDLDEAKKALITTTNTIFNEGNTDMGTKPNVVKESITNTIAKKNIDTVNKKEKSEASNKAVDISRNNKYGKVESLYKSSSTQRTDTENTVNTADK